MTSLSPHTTPQRSAAVLRHMTRLASHRQLEVRLGALDVLARGGSAAAPAFITLARAARNPQTRLEAARWLRLSHHALPIAIQTCTALAMHQKEHVAREALAELDAVRGAEGIPEALARIAMQGATPLVRSSALEALRRRSEQSDPTALGRTLADSPAAALADRFRAAAWPTEASDFPRALGSMAGQAMLGSGALAAVLPLPGGALAAAASPSLGQRLRDLSTLSPWRFAMLLVGTITLAEVLITVADARLGLLLHIATLFLLLYTMLQPGGVHQRRYRTVLPLVPLIRILSLGLPLAAWPQITWYFAVSVPLFAAIAIVIQLEPWTRAELGLTLSSLPEQLAIGMAGLALGWIEYQILRPTPLSQELTWQALWLPALILVVSTGYLEELLFRGLLQSASIPVLGRWPAILFVTTLFAVLHIGYASLLDVGFVFAVGLAFSIIVARTQSLLGVTLAHSLTNISLFLLWPQWLR